MDRFPICNVLGIPTNKYLDLLEKGYEVANHPEQHNEEARGGRTHRSEGARPQALRNAPPHPILHRQNHLQAGQHSLPRLLPEQRGARPNIRPLQSVCRQPHCNRSTKGGRNATSNRRASNRGWRHSKYLPNGRARPRHYRKTPSLSHSSKRGLSLRRRGNRAPPRLLALSICKCRASRPFPAPSRSQSSRNTYRTRHPSTTYR